MTCLMIVLSREGIGNLQQKPGNYENGFAEEEERNLFETRTKYCQILGKVKCLFLFGGRTRKGGANLLYLWGRTSRGGDELIGGELVMGRNLRDSKLLQQRCSLLAGWQANLGQN